MPNETISIPRYYLLREDKRPLRLSGADLLGLDMHEAHLVSANFREANLQETNLQKANLKFAKLQEANLKHADLQKAILQDADLRSANLQDANLKEAVLESANLTDANLKYAKELTKEQVLLAHWGIHRGGGGKPPTLPDELMQDEVIQKWCKIPNFEWVGGDVNGRWYRNDKSALQKS